MVHTLIMWYLIYTYSSSMLLWTGGGTYHILLSGALLPMLQGESVEKSSREVRSQVVKQTFFAA